VPLKSCTSVTVTVNKIVVALGEKCKAGTVTGSTTTTTTSKSPGNTTTTRTRMTVTIKDVMPQGIETTVEREAGDNIVNNGNVGIEMLLIVVGSSYSDFQHSVVLCYSLEPSSDLSQYCYLGPIPTYPFLQDKKIGGE
jgi:hypothetical protein